MKDIFGEALYDFNEGRFDGSLILHNSYGRPEEIPVDGYFYTDEDFSEMEEYAISLCYGKVLDVGAAAGRHTLFLQNEGFDVVGLDISEKCVGVMKKRGIGNSVVSDVCHYSGGTFDTILLLMNGIGIAGTMDGFVQLVTHLKHLLNRNGQILFDSTDVSYLYDQESIKNVGDRYYGEIDYCFEYKKSKGTWFSWLYIDIPTMEKTVRALGGRSQILYENEDNAYLARINFD